MNVTVSLFVSTVSFGIEPKYLCPRKACVARATCACSCVALKRLHHPGRHAPKLSSKLPRAQAAKPCHPMNRKQQQRQRLSVPFRPLSTRPRCPVRTDTATPNRVTNLKRGDGFGPKLCSCIIGSYYRYEYVTSKTTLTNCGRFFLNTKTILRGSGVLTLGNASPSLKAEVSTIVF